MAAHPGVSEHMRHACYVAHCGRVDIAWAGVHLLGVILFDIFVRGHRQRMGVMNAVYPITALYLGPFAVWLYRRWRRQAAGGTVQARRRTNADMPRMAGAQTDAREKPRWVSMAIEVSHCGSGCTLGDVIGEWTIYALALTVAGHVLFAEYIGDYVLALAFGIVFQYFAIAPMRGLGLRDGLKAAARADFVSLTFFEVGLFGWMALMTFVFFRAPHHLGAELGRLLVLDADRDDFGFCTSWPANVWLVNRGVKVPM